MIRSALTMLFMFSFVFALPILIDRDGFFRFDEKTALESNAGHSVELAPMTPRQGKVGRQDNFTRQLGDFEILPLAKYEVDALVLGRQNYDHDLTSSISPTDLALGWGPVSNPALRPYFHLFQKERASFLKVRSDIPIGQKSFMKNFSNTHMIPADEDVRRALARVREGDLVSFSGFLVQVRRSSGGMEPWSSSMSRNDTGNGACEIVLITQISSASTRTGS